MTKSDSSPDLYTLLIGINCYLPNRLSDGSIYGNLDGAVKDIIEPEPFADAENPLLFFKNKQKFFFYP